MQLGRVDCMLKYKIFTEQTNCAPYPSLQEFFLYLLENLIFLDE